jgi:hypothetical protein
MESPFSMSTTRAWVGIGIVVCACGGSLTDLVDAGDASVDATNDVGDESDVTISPCAKNEVLCGNACFVNDVNHCGASCVQCGAPAHGKATCDGTSCGFTCDALQCGSTCVDPMSDTANCGKCGHDCLGTQCNAGACVPQLIYAMNGVQAMTSDATNLYWIGAGTNALAVYKGLKTGNTTPTTLVPSVGYYYSIPRRYMAVDAQNVYFAIESSLLSVPINGGSLGGYAISTTWPTNPAIDSQNIYYGPGDGTGSLVSEPLDGGTPTPLLSVPLTNVVKRSGSTLYYGTVQGNSVGSLWRTSATTPDAGTTQVFAGDASASIYVLSIGPTGDVFFANTVTLFDINPDGGTTALVSADVEAVVADATTIYFATFNNGSYTVQQQPIGGTTATPIASGSGVVETIEVDNSFLYYGVYANQNAGIYRAVK